MNIDEEEPNCNICFEPYDDDEHSPRTLRCGHTLCTPCIDVLVKKNLSDRVCPECRKTLKISNASHLPISYTILRLSRALAKVKPSAEVQVQVIDNNTCMKHGAPTISWCPLSDKWHCFKCVHTDKCESLLSVPEAFLHIKQNQSQNVEGKLNNASNLAESLTAERETLEKEIAAARKRISEISEKLEQIKEHSDKLETDEAELVEASTTIRLTKALVRLKRDIASYDAFYERSQPSVRSRRPTSATTALSNFEELKEHLHQFHNVYVVHDSEMFETRWARLSLDGFYLMMHALEDESPPAGSHVIPFESVLGGLDKDAPLAFFDIECKNDFEGRVMFEMFGTTPRAKQFLKLCTGEDGPCYKDTPVMEFEEPHHRYLRGGLLIQSMYTEPIVDDITDGGRYRRALTPGLLNGWKKGDEYWSLFDIVLDCKPNYEDDYSFGKVMCGLSLLKGVCEQSQNKRKMRINDCGIAIEL